MMIITRSTYRKCTVWCFGSVPWFMFWSLYLYMSLKTTLLYVSMYRYRYRRSLQLYSPYITNQIDLVIQTKSSFKISELLPISIQVKTKTTWERVTLKKGHKGPLRGKKNRMSCPPNLPHVFPPPSLFFTYRSKKI